MYLPDEDPNLAARACDHPDCDGEGRYPAPSSRERLRHYHWFCLDHVRAYNAAWDFFAGMGAEEIDRFRHADLTWHRPTWRIGPGSSFNGTFAGEGVHDAFALFNRSQAGEKERFHGGVAVTRIARGDREALSVMDLDPSVTVKDIKRRFKELAKRFHPDANGGDKSTEDKLKVVIQAYRFLLGRRRG